jgi:RNA polymerase sigma-70 factor (ECF subfamily)
MAYQGSGTMTDWDRIMREHGSMVFATAWRVLGHAADCEDVVQEVFLEAHRLTRIERIRNWGGLLRRLAMYRALDRLRQRREFTSLDGALLPAADGPEAAAMRNELAERLRQVIGQLPEREATVFCLRYFEELPYQTIADTLDISTGAVATALHKARTKLESLLAGVVKGE